MKPLLQVHDLHVAYRSRSNGDVPALAGVSFEMQSGEWLGVLGESGSGKSTLAAAIPQLLPPNGRVEKGAIRFEDQDLLETEPREMEKIRGRRISIIYQEPSLSLHPTLRVGEQISDVIAAHESIDRRTLREKTLPILSAVFPAEAKRISNSYPHQLSGGQRQRVLIAQAIACRPTLLIADEPTASLDASTQHEILELLRALRKQLNLAMMLICHNPAILAGLADRVLILYAGRVAEIGPAEDVLMAPQHPYTRALLQCLPPPALESSLRPKTRLPVIAGDSPNPAQFAKGCRFEPRCEDRMDVCRASEPGETLLDNRHGVSCFKYGD